MKKYLNQIKAVVILAAVVAAVVIFNFARASSSYVPSNPPQSNPAPFLDISSTAQAKQGWLALGAPSSSYNPMAVLDVQGTAIADVLGVLGSGWVSGNLEVGGTNPPVLTNPALVVEGSRIRSSVLAGTGDRPVCADSNGLLTLCATTAVNGTCGSADNVTVSSAPTTNLCNSGTASTVTGTGPWSWTCAGSGGGSTATCQAPKTTTPINGACGPNADTCITGTLSGATVLSQGGGSIDEWSCMGSNGGTNDLDCQGPLQCPTGEAPGCFLPGTDVTLANGTKKPIESVTTSDSVLTTGGANKVQALINHQYQGWVYGINGSKPFVTGDHPMMTTEGWKSFEPNITKVTDPDVPIVGAIQIGDILLKQNGVQEKVASFTRVWMDTKVYNLTVSGNDEYYADSYEVHNTNSNVNICVSNPGGTGTSTNLCGSPINPSDTAAGGVGNCNLGTAGNTAASTCPTNTTDYYWDCTVSGTDKSSYGVTPPPDIGSDAVLVNSYGWQDTVHSSVYQCYSPQLMCTP